MRRIILIPAIILFLITFILYLSGAFLLKSVLPNPKLSPTLQSPFIEEAIRKQESFICSYTDSKGNWQKVYIKGDKFRIDGGKTFGGPGSTVLVNNQLWIWGTTKNEGFTIKLPNLKSIEKNVSIEATRQEILAPIEKNKKSCLKETVGDDVFAIPQKVKFQDFSAIMGVR